MKWPRILFALSLVLNVALAALLLVSCPIGGDPHHRALKATHEAYDRLLRHILEDLESGDSNRVERAKATLAYSLQLDGTDAAPPALP